MAIDCCDTQFLENRWNKTREQIQAAETALDSLVVGGVQSYTLDTGQTRQVVTKQNLSILRNYLKELYARYDELGARLGCGRMIGRPA